MGQGRWVIALAEAMKDMGINYQHCLHVTAMDIDRRAVHMAYIQFTLMHIPAVVIEGDTLRMTIDDEWHTLAHVMGNWTRKLAKAEEVGTISVNEVPTISNQNSQDIMMAHGEAQAASFNVGKGGQLQLF